MHVSIWLFLHCVSEAQGFLEMCPLCSTSHCFDLQASKTEKGPFVYASYVYA